jgi:prepilin signal peptidase PulO-like enzyme (type II secretory pathway)
MVSELTVPWLSDAAVVLFGLVVGSFANVLIARLPGHQGIGGRSRCPACGHELAARDLVPLLSWALLRARCRYCRAPISARYPLVEVLTATLWLLTWRAAGRHLALGLLHLLYATAMVVIFFTDFEQAIIPNTVVLPAAGVALAAAGLRLDPGGPSLLAGGLAALAGGGLFLLLFVVSGGAGMGMGDVKLMLYLGLALGPLKLLLAVLGGSLAALAMAALIIAFFRHRVRALSSVKVSLYDEEEPAIRDRFMGIMLINGKPAVPLGTFLVLGYFGAYFWGDRIIAVWLGI